MSGFGQYAGSGDYTKCKNGTYPATITSAKIVLENGKPKLHPESHKASVDVAFQLDLETDDGPVELNRRFNVTYGKNRTTGSYSNWALLIEAATGVACGDKAQGHVGERELTGKRLNVRAKNVESNGNKYTNIVDFEPLEDAGPGFGRYAEPTPRAAAAQSLGIEEDDLDEIPF